MNKRGINFEFILFGLGIVTFIVVILVILFQEKPIEEVDYTYKEMELSLVTSTKAYLRKEYKGKLSDGSMKVKMSELFKKGYYTKIYDPSDVDSMCEGYVLVEIFAGVGFYEPYVKCNQNYKTVNYR